MPEPKNTTFTFTVKMGPGNGLPHTASDLAERLRQAARIIDKEYFFDCHACTPEELGCLPTFSLRGGGIAKFVDEPIKEPTHA